MDIVQHFVESLITPSRAARFWHNQTNQISDWPSNGCPSGKFATDKHENSWLYRTGHRAANLHDVIYRAHAPLNKPRANYRRKTKPRRLDSLSAAKKLLNCPSRLLISGGGVALRQRPARLRSWPPARRPTFAILREDGCTICPMWLSWFWHERNKAWNCIVR